MSLCRLSLPMLGLLTVTAGILPAQAQTRLDPYGSPAPAVSAPTPRARPLPPPPAVDPVAAAEQKASSNVNASNDYFVRLRQDIQRRQQKVAQLEAELARREKAYREMTQDLNDQAQSQRSSGAAASLAGAGTGTPAPAGGAAEQGGGELTQKYKQAEQQALYIRSLKYDITTQKKEISRLSQLLKH